MSDKRYWQRFEQLEQPAQTVDPKTQRDIPVDELVENALPSNRRDFLKMMGFGVSAAVLAACSKTPVKYALPYTYMPTDQVPGISNYYASSVYDGQELVSVLVKTKEGRPIKIEGNKLAPIQQGGVSARAHASILSLYDNSDSRLRQPMAVSRGAEGKLTTTPVDWAAIDKAVTEKLNEAAAGNKDIVIITGSIISPSTRAALAQFKAKYPTTKHVMYDAISHQAIIDAHKALFDKGVIPAYRFDKAEVIVGSNCDFLGTWLSPTEFTRQWALTRKLDENKKKISRHYQFEANMSLTGANADYRIPMLPSQEGLVLLGIYNRLAQRAGKETFNVTKVELPGKLEQKAADDLWAARGKALLVSGTNDPNIQQVVAAINSLLGAYGTTIDLDAPCQLRQAGDLTLEQALPAMGNAAIAFVYGTNPAYSYPKAEAFTAAFSKVPLRISLSSYLDDTAAYCTHAAPSHHYLEAWGDNEPYKGHLYLQQPTIQPLFKTRQFEENFLKWAGDSTTYFEFVKKNWAETAFKDDLGAGNKWMKALHDGFYVASATEDGSKSYEISGTIGSAANALSGAKPVSGYEVITYQKVGIGDGTQANNPWLQELPDPISKVCWDNYITISREDAKKLDVALGDMLKVTANGATLELPVYIMPGQMIGTVGVALGYGRTMGGKVIEIEQGPGKNAYPFTSLQAGYVTYTATGGSLEKAAGSYDLALSQMSLTAQGRTGIVKETTLAEYTKNPKAGNEENIHIVNIFPTHPKDGHRWGMAIDMNACTGCGACVVSCIAENNIAVVGRTEVRRGREMHWLRIDRYFSVSEAAQKEKDAGHYAAAEAPEDYPEVVFQPMMCQQCDNAPCETVCPVLATTHSSEGLNQMTYNRCIGTRYCANNCPYKVRRFNWLDYTGTDKLAQAQTEYRVPGKFRYNPVDSLGRMVLNPDVTVRARGVMEKCTFCVQRLQTAKLEAKKQGVFPVDGSFETACSQSCPSGAILFGDLNDPESKVAKAHLESRKYLSLEEVKALPKVAYMTKVRNQDTVETTA